MILYIAMSTDGFIAGENGNIDFLNEFQVEGEDYGYKNFIKTISSILVGRKTYEKVINMGYPYHEDKDVYVITRNSKPSSKKLHFYNEDLNKLINELKGLNSGDIYCDGGAELAQALISIGLIDKIILSIIPVNLHKGTLLFKNGFVPSEFLLESQVKFKTGLTQFTYNLKSN
ncbi:MAG: dihydrofolate reductase family protein [Flavobacteriaceae bacterium]|nr:dihydrofolate reductase family protein [Flavobacteriaceae bacterium]